MTNNTRGSVNNKIAHWVGTFIIIDIGVLATAFTVGLAWKVFTWLVPGLGGC